MEGIVQHSERQNVIVNLSSKVNLKAFSTTSEIHSGKVLVGVRPEHIRLKREQPQTTNNVLEGRLIDMTFMGATRRFHIEFGDKIIAVSTLPSSDHRSPVDQSYRAHLWLVHNFRKQRLYQYNPPSSRFYRKTVADDF